MQLVEYTVMSTLNRPPYGPRIVKASVDSAEAGITEINRLLHDYPVRGYNEEKDYYWGRKRAAGSETVILKLQA